MRKYRIQYFVSIDESAPVPCLLLKYTLLARVSGRAWKHDTYQVISVFIIGTMIFVHYKLISENTHIMNKQTDIMIFVCRN